jgi:hypothetical protein
LVEKAERDVRSFEAQIWATRHGEIHGLGADRLPDRFPNIVQDTIVIVLFAIATTVILQDRIFFYGSARYARETKWDRVNKVATPLPDEIRTAQEFYGKLTAVPTARHQLNVGYRHRPSHVENAGIDSSAAPSVATDTDNGSGIASAEWATFMTGRSSLSVRYLYMKENNEDEPVMDLGYLPPFNPDNLTAMGQYTDPAQADLKVGGNQFTNIQNYRRHEARPWVLRSRER